MSQNPEKPEAPTGPERSTRRGLGAPEVRRDPRAASGAFPREWPELSDLTDSLDAELGSGDEATTARLQRSTGTTAEGPKPQSRGPEYHPPVTPPGGSRERAFLNSGGSGTFRVTQPASVQVRAAALEGADSGFRPSSPTVPPIERIAREGSEAWLPLGSKRFLISAALGLVIGSGVALGVVRVPVRALGVLKATGAPESLGASVAGSVAEVKVSAGDEVQPGDPVLSIHSPVLQSAFDSSRAELEFLRKELEAAGEDEKSVLLRSLGTLERRRQILAQRVQLKEAEFVQRKTLVDDVTALVNAGSAHITDLAEANAGLSAATESRLGIVDALSQLDLEIADRRGEHQVRSRARRARLLEAEARVDQAERALGVTLVRAPARGFIESLLVTTGSSVQPGTEIARLIPHSAPRSVVALVALEDAGDVMVGEEASVELSPHNQNGGALAARIKHVSHEVAPPARVQAILGMPSAEGFVQLELELLDSSEYHALESKLRTGSKAMVSFATPHRRLGGVLYDAIREWFAFGSWG